MPSRAELLAWGRQVKSGAEFLSYLAVIVGVFVYFVFEREDARQNARIEHVLQYIEQFQEGDIAASRKTLVLLWIERRPQLQQIQGRAAPASAIQRWVLKQGDRQEETAVFALTEYFDQIGLCVEKKICDELTAKEYFGSYAESFYCLYKLVIEGFVENMVIPDLGKGVVELAPEPLSCAPPAVAPPSATPEEQGEG